MAWRVLGEKFVDGFGEQANSDSFGVPAVRLEGLLQRAVCKDTGSEVTSDTGKA